MHPATGVLKLRQLRQSIYARYLLITAATTILIALGLSYHAYASEMRLVERSLARLADSSTTMIANSLSNSVKIGDVKVAETRLEQLLMVSDGLMQSGAIFGTNGEKIAATQGIPASAMQAMQRAAHEGLSSGQTSFDSDQNFAKGLISGDDGLDVGIIVTFWTAMPILAVMKTDKIITSLVTFTALGILLILSKVQINAILRKPMQTLESSIKDLSKGDYQISIGGRHHNNEIGRMAAHLETLRVGLVNAKQETLQQKQLQQQEQQIMLELRHRLKALANGDLTAEITMDLPRDYAQLGEDFNNTAKAFRTTIRQVMSLAHIISTEAEDIGRNSDDLALRTENGATTLEETATALDELTTGIQDAAEGTREVSVIINATQTEANESGEIVRRTVGAMDEIEQSSTQISEIIAVIDDIAFQTNLLALNAGVEAARAGDAGRGFAVVASEVRGLAGRSSQAASEIKDLISNSSVHVSKGVTLVRSAGKALTGITERVAEISELMTTMADNTTEQSSSLNEINEGVSHLDQATQGNAGMVNEATLASRKLLQQAKSLSDLVGHFNTDRTHRDVYHLKNRVA